MYESLDIKNIQLETLNHIISDVAMSFGYPEEAFLLQQRNFQIYASNQRETPEMLIQAYQYSSYSRVEEFLEFEERLDLSLQQRITEIDVVKHGLLCDIKK